MFGQGMDRPFSSSCFSATTPASMHDSALRRKALHKYRGYETVIGMIIIAALIGASIAWFTPLTALAPAVFVALGPESEKADILFGGDMLFDRSVRAAMRTNGDDYIFSCLPQELWDADLVVANLEGPITTHASISEGSAPGDANNFTFTFPTSTATLLKRHNIMLVNLGNNHIMNFSREGLIQTKGWLSKAGVAYFGDPEKEEEDRVARPTINGIPFSFVNWSDWTSDKTDHTVAQVRKEAGAGRVTVVYTHWGDEYVSPPPRVRQLAHSFVDAGADIVIGSHPHIVQEHEVYKGRDIYYSLGNFVFDQYWNDDVRSGLLLRVTFDTKGVRDIEEIPIHLERNRQTCLRE